MIVTATELKTNLGKYLEIAKQQDVFITKNGKTIARLTSPSVNKLSVLDSLVGIVPAGSASMKKLYTGGASKQAMKILIDTNVIIDILQKREPFFGESYHALRKAIENDVECMISASAVTDIFYMLRKSLGSNHQAKEADRAARTACGFRRCAGMDIHAALMRTMPDFEDAVVDAVAERNGASYILTRNIKDFTDSVVTAILPADYLNL